MTMKNTLKHHDLLHDFTSIILESISDGVFTVDDNWKITSFNRAAEEITGILRTEAIGKYCSEVFRASMCEVDCALRQTLETGKPVINRSAFIIDAKGHRIPISVSTSLLLDQEGNMVGGVETFRDLTLVEELKKQLEGRSHLGDFISRSSLVHKIFDLLPLVAESNSTILIQGETGTGKELLSRTIHSLSPRKNGPFIAVNCGALPDTLLESELFGYKAGAFTGANKDKPGRFTLAKGGTIFLDEIGDITPALQVRLLRVLQEKTFEPLGSTHSEKADVRIITATHKNLFEEVQQGNFRQDLYYRINIVRLDIPPLRQRKEDIPLLVEHFIRHFNGIQGKTITGIHPEVLEDLMAHDFPGNVRELENIMEHAFVLCEKEDIQPCHMPKDIQKECEVLSSESGGDLNAMMKSAEVRLITEALKKNRYNRLAAARELGIHKSTLFRKMKLLGIHLPDYDGRSRKIPS